MRSVVAEVHASAADAVLVAHNHQKLGTHLVAAWSVEELAWRQKARGRIKRGGGGGDAAKAVDKQLQEPHTGARPSVRLCVGPELARCVY